MFDLKVSFDSKILFQVKMQGRRNEFKLTGAKNRRLANGRQGEEKFWSEKSYFYYIVLRLRIKVHKSSEKVQN